jgi:hypothetical protein
MSNLKNIIIARVPLDDATEMISGWCKELIEDHKIKNANTISDISRDFVSIDNILKLGQPDPDNFVLLAFYGHGTLEDGFWLDSEKRELLNCATVHNFKDYILYAACCSTLKMGDVIRNKSKIKTVVGYNGPFDLILKNERYTKCFKKCLNSGLFFILTHDTAPLEAIYNYMYEVFDSEIFYCLQHQEEESDALIGALMLQSNQRKLGILGDKNFIIIK